MCTLLPLTVATTYTLMANACTYLQTTRISSTCSGMFCGSSGSAPSDEQRVMKKVRPPLLQGSGNGMIAPLMRMIWLELVLHSQKVLAASKLEGGDELKQGDEIEGKEESEEEKGGTWKRERKSW